MITTKKHLKIIEIKDKIINELNNKVYKLERELEEAKNLKELLGKFESNFASIGYANNVLSNFTLSLPDTVLQYTDDILGGKVIKQEGTKCLIISKDGDVKTGLTKSKPDKGYKYKLVRE